MNCPHCETPIDEHEKTDCLDAWVHEVVMGKPVEWVEEHEEEFPLTNISDGSEHKNTYTVKGYFFDRTDQTTYMHATDGFRGMIPKYSWWIGDAWRVVEHWNDDEERYFNLAWNVAEGKNYWSAAFWKGFDKTRWIANAPKPQAPLAICRAAIKANSMQDDLTAA